MPTHECSREELGLEGSNPRFMTPREDATNYTSLYQKKFRCLDEKDLFIRGNFNTAHTSNIRVLLKKCSGKDYCKSDEEILDFVRGKFILVYLNQIRFDSGKYGEESIIKESRIDWLRVSTIAQSEYPYLVEKTELYL